MAGRSAIHHCGEGLDEWLPTILPLPLGEGWGEGNSSRGTPKQLFTLSGLRFVSSLLFPLRKNSLRIRAGYGFIPAVRNGRRAEFPPTNRPLVAHCERTVL